MSISLVIDRRLRRDEVISVCGQSAADVAVAALKDEHGFTVFTGVWPIFIEPSDLERAVNEFGLIGKFWDHDARKRMITEDAERIAQRCSRIMKKLKDLRTESNWSASFG